MMSPAQSRNPAMPRTANSQFLPMAPASPLAIAQGGNHVTPDIAPPPTQAAHP